MSDYLEYQPSKNELKSLHDSLTAFFTPTCVRRSRLSSMGAGGLSYNEENNFSLNSSNEQNKAIEIEDKGLQIIIDCDYSDKNNGPVSDRALKYSGNFLIE